MRVGCTGVTISFQVKFKGYPLLVAAADASEEGTFKNIIAKEMCVVANSELGQGFDKNRSITVGIQELTDPQCDNDNKTGVGYVSVANTIFF